ncbi:metallophosphoesterase [Cytobacillus sp. Hz8]|uniref:metallophosphoesterase n=1 Tax=Cytobacillus sp. Hz8 TaxID=3347168 RepID=UPI0035E02B14
MPKKITRRSFMKKIFTSFLTVTGISAGGYYYAHEIEPRFVETKKMVIQHSKIPSAFDGFKMIQFNDTHLGFQYNLTQLKKITKQINALEPDIILFNGDLMDAPNQFKNPANIIPILQELKAPFGKFAIYGNHDHGGYGSNLYKDIMTKSGFTLLRNQAKKIELLGNSSIYIVGIDDAMLGKPDLDKAFQNVPKEAYKILLSHAPDLADQSYPFGAELQLSGHSHGGQIKIPFLGALVTSPYGEKYIEGLFTIGKKNPLTLYVNRGLGTTRLPFRFLSRPELTVITLAKK